MGPRSHRSKVWVQGGDVLETLLGSEFSQRSAATANLERILGFPRRTPLPGASADYARSLIVLGVCSEYTVRTSFHGVSGPMIQRTGVAAPTMDGLHLQFDSDRIDKPAHQRCGSLFFTLEARSQAMTELLIEFINCWPFSIVPECPLRARRTLAESEARWVEHRLTDILNGRTLEDRLTAALEFVDPPVSLRQSVEFALRSCLNLRAGPDDHSSEKIWVQLSEAQKNALSALYLQRQHRLKQDRHLGPSRMGNFTTGKVSHLTVQGAGDFSMNPWNVAFFRDGNGNDCSFIPANEPFGSRRYTCLMGLKTQLSEAVKTYLDDSGRRAGHVAIAPLHFSPGPVALADLHTSVDVRPDIDFALYGKMIVNNGRVVEPVEVIDEFLDLRHIFDLPNLNVDNGRIADLESAHLRVREHVDPESWARLARAMESRPRHLFGQLQSADVWLLEKALLEDQNLRRLACFGAVAVPLHELGAPKDWVTVCLTAWSYRLKFRPESIAEGEFAWDLNDIARPVLWIHLRRSKYPCTAIGVGSVEKGPQAVPDCVYMLAWGHEFRYGRHSIQDCASVLAAAGARWALAIDEGQDVFQFFAEDQAALNHFLNAELQGDDVTPFFAVPFAYNPLAELRCQRLRRTGLRASLAVWHERDE